MKKYFVDKINIEKGNGTCMLIDTSINTVKNESFKQFLKKATSLICQKYAVIENVFMWLAVIICVFSLIIDDYLIMSISGIVVSSITLKNVMKYLKSDIE